MRPMNAGLQGETAQPITLGLFIPGLLDSQKRGCPRTTIADSLYVLEAGFRDFTNVGALFQRRFLQRAHRAC